MKLNKYIYIQSRLDITICPDSWKSLKVQIRYLLNIVWEIKFNRYIEYTSVYRYIEVCLSLINIVLYLLRKNSISSSKSALFSGLFTLFFCCSCFFKNSLSSSEASLTKFVFKSFILLYSKRFLYITHVNNSFSLFLSSLTFVVIVKTSTHTI